MHLVDVLNVGDGAQNLVDISGKCSIICFCHPIHDYQFSRLELWIYGFMFLDLVQS